LESWLSKRDFSNAIILFMSSGNYDGLDVAQFSEKITNTAE
jgi:UDP-N-acetylmuramate: L-alanyl-gamma-D-glutamyl-meso-diaminopimelate ligase